MKERANHIGLRLAVETSVLVFLAGAWLWGIVALGAHATAAQGTAPGGVGPSESAAVSCPAPRETEEGGTTVGGAVCRVEPRLDAGTSRQPGRSSENAPSTHSGG